MDLIPPEIIATKYFTNEQHLVDELNIQLETARNAVTEHAEEYGSDEGVLVDGTNDKGVYTKQLINIVIKDAKTASDSETLNCAIRASELLEIEANAKKSAKDAQAALDMAIIRKYSELTEEEIKNLVLDDKWKTTVLSRITSEVEALSLALVSRIHELGERYEETVEELDQKLAKAEAIVATHLTDMGVKL